MSGEFCAAPCAQITEPRRAAMMMDLVMPPAISDDMRAYRLFAPPSYGTVTSSGASDVTSSMFTGVSAGSSIVSAVCDAIC